MESTYLDKIKKGIGFSSIFFLIFIAVFTLFHTVNYVPNSYTVNETNEFNDTITVEKLYYGRSDLVPIKNIGEKNAMTQWGMESALAVLLVCIIYVFYITRKNRIHELIEEIEHKKTVSTYFNNIKTITEFRVKTQSHLQFSQADMNTPIPHRRWYFVEANYEGIGWKTHAISIDPFSHRIYSILDLPSYMLVGEDFIKIYGDFQYRTPQGLNELRHLFGFGKQKIDQ